MAELETEQSGQSYGDTPDAHKFVFNLGSFVGDLTVVEEAGRLYWLGRKRLSLWPCKRLKDSEMSSLDEVLFWFLLFEVKLGHHKQRRKGLVVRQRQLLHFLP
ncbi:hypothetical protein LguiA_013023 [Lonicera macranthoides]